MRTSSMPHTLRTDIVELADPPELVLHPLSSPPPDQALTINTVVTTMGVGELSALNGIAGAYTEQVKVIHIVGTTPMAAHEKRLMIHHCLGPSPDHKVNTSSLGHGRLPLTQLNLNRKVYEKISQHVRAAHCWLDNPATAAKEIDVSSRQLEYYCCFCLFC